MGIGPTALKLYDDLASEKLLKPGMSVCELGAQDYVPESYKTRLYSIFGIEPPVLQWRSGREFYAYLGFVGYDCIDLDGSYDALKLDLNTVGWGEIGRTYDVVTNHGTTEHVFNQYNCFKLIHDLTKPSGLMVHIVPHGKGCEDHGLYLHSVHFFPDLSRANGYKLIRHYTAFDGRHVLIIAAMLKGEDKPFVTPFQEIYRGIISPHHSFGYD